MLDLPRSDLAALRRLVYIHLFAKLPDELQASFWAPDPVGLGLDDLTRLYDALVRATDEEPKFERVRQLSSPSGN